MIVLFRQRQLTFCCLSKEDNVMKFTDIRYLRTEKLILMPLLNY